MYIQLSLTFFSLSRYHFKKNFVRVFDSNQIFFSLSGKHIRHLSIFDHEYDDIMQ